MDIEEIIEKMKDIISRELPNQAVYDKDVAKVLGISKASLSHFKKRKRLPLDAIVYFCATRSISINWLLFDQMPQSLQRQEYALWCQNRQ